MSKIVRQACFACTTPYQTIGAINIAKANKLDADLYLFGMFEGYEKVAERLREYGIFANVYAIDNKKFRHVKQPVKGFLIAFSQMLFAEKVTAEFLPKDIVYEEYYSTSRAHGKTLLQSVLKKRNPNLREVIFEDGTGSYVKTSKVYVPSSRKKKMETLLGWKLFDPANTEVMVNLPQILDLPELYADCKVSRMPSLYDDPSFRAMLLDIFGATPETRISQNTVIFDTLRNWDLGDKDPLGLKLDECYNVVAQVIKPINVICKPHPRSLNSTTLDIAVYQYTGIPMELLYLDMNDLDKRLFVCLDSTAAYTPKMLLGKEPYIVFLHRIVFENGKNTAGEEVYRRLYHLYKKKDRVAAPETIEQLKEYLLRIEKDDAGNVQ